MSTAMTLLERVEKSQAIALLNQRAVALRDLLRDDMAVARFNRGVVIAITKNPDLLSCTPESIMLACFEAAQLGVEPTGASGGAHLVPYKLKGGDKVAQLIPDYRGVIRLITRGGHVLSVSADVVKEGDEFAYQLGSEPWLEHVPKLDPGRSQRASTHAYAVFRLRAGAPVIVVDDMAGIERIRKRGANSDRSPWVTDWDPMAIKTMVKRGAKLCPVEPAVRAILVREDELGGDRDPDPTLAVTAGSAQGSRVSRLASRLKPVGPEAPTDEPIEGQVSEVDGQAWAGDEPALTELSAAAFKALREQHEVSLETVAAAAKQLYPEAKGLNDLTDEQRAALWLRIAAAASEA